MPLHRNVHLSIKPPGENYVTVKGDYIYYHYDCDGTNDQGWGCGYRTLQSICSWIKCQQQSLKEVPTIKQIQQALVTMEDKPSTMINSRDWIGSFEVSICVDFFFDVPCKIVHVRSGSELIDHLPEIENHFKIFGSPVMMGGDTDNASKCVLGVCMDPESLLILDPHCYDKNPTMADITNSGLVAWRQLDSFSESSFYNLCMPQLKGKHTDTV